MAADTLTLTPGAVAAKRAIMFPYPPGRTSADYTRTLSSLTVNSVSYIEGRDFDLSFEEPGVTLKWKAAAIAAGYGWQLNCTLVVPPGGAALVPQTFGLTDQLGSRTPLMAFAGDSIQATTTSQNTSLLINYANLGMQYWIPILTGQGVKTRVDLNFGVSSNTSTQLLARIDAVCASDADIVLVQIGTNDMGAGISFTQTITNIAEIWGRLLAAGKLVIALPPLPRDSAGTYPLTSAQVFRLWRVIRWVEGQQVSGRRNFYVIDTAAIFVNPTSAAGAPKTGYSGDGLHPTTIGDYYTSQKVVALLNSLFPAGASTFANVTDIYNVTDNPTGNLLTNGLLDGTGAVTTNAVGTLAGSFAANFELSHVTAGGTFTDVTTTGTKITHPVDGRPGQRIAMAGNYNGTSSGLLNGHSLMIFQQLFGSFTNFSIGDTLRARCEIIKGAAATENIAGIELQFNAVQAGVTHRRGCGSSYGLNLPIETFAATLETPSLTLTAVPTTVVCGIRVYFKVGAHTLGSSFDLYGLKLEKVVA